MNSVCMKETITEPNFSIQFVGKLEQIRFLKGDTPNPVSRAQMKYQNKEHHCDENWHRDAL